MASSKQNFVCTLCLEPFEKPKILPCIHTFCEKCLSTLISKQNKKEFSCPNCRKTIPVPNGGVGAFPTNIYIETDDLGRTLTKYLCKTHPQNEVVSYCTSCEDAICVDCMLGEHKPHEIKTIATMAVASKAQLTQDKIRLQNTVDTMEKLKQDSEQKQKIVKEHTIKVAYQIRARCSQLVSSAEKHRDEQLAKLDVLEKTLDSTEMDAGIVASLTDKCSGLARDQQEIQRALDSGGDCQVVMLAREMKVGRGSEGVLRAMLSADWPQEEFDVPCLHTGHFKASDGSKGLVSTVIGEVRRKVLQLQTELSLSVVTHCPRRSIYFLTISRDGCFSVSYKKSGVPVQKFDMNGQLIESVKGIRGKVTMQYMASGDCLYITAHPASDRLALCAKYNHLYVFEHCPPSQGIVQKVEIRGTKAFVTDWVPMLTLSCGHCLAFDTNDSGTQFAVLEQQPDRSTCVVKIYNMSVPEPVHSFELGSSPRADICFYVAKGKEVLLVTDETHSRVLAFSTESSRLTPVIPMSSLMHPVALNTDTAGRVWIGCKDGRIFTCDNLVVG